MRPRTRASLAIIERLPPSRRQRLVRPQHGVGFGDPTEADEGVRIAVLPGPEAGFVDTLSIPKTEQRLQSAEHALVIGACYRQLGGGQGSTGHR
jgi:hypothetical protein